MTIWKLRVFACLVSRNAQQESEVHTLGTCLGTHSVCEEYQRLGHIWDCVDSRTWRNSDVSELIAEKTFRTRMSMGKCSGMCVLTHTDRMHNRRYHASAGRCTEGFCLLASTLWRE
jgi:hypothetical protein